MPLYSRQVSRIRLVRIFGVITTRFRPPTAQFGASLARSVIMSFIGGGDMPPKSLPLSIEWMTALFIEGLIGASSKLLPIVSIMPVVLFMPKAIAVASYSAVPGVGR